MESAPSKELQGVTEEIVEVDENINEIEVVIGDPKAPNKDTNTIVKVVVTGEHVTIPSDLKEKIFSEGPFGDQYNYQSSYGRRRDYS